MEHIIATTLYDSSDWDYADYEDFCEVNGYEPTDFDEWVADTVQEYYLQDIANIRDYEKYNVPVVIRGTLGLWDGRHKIEPVQVGSVYEAIERCLGHSIADVEVKWVDGAIMVYAYHHDGCNILEISALDGDLPYLYN